MEKPVYVNNIAELAAMSGFPPQEHPVFAVIKIEELRGLPASFFKPVIFNFFTIGLKQNVRNATRYGRNTYDFTKGVLGFTAPNQVMEINPELGESATGWMCFFQREFLKNHPLQEQVDQYGFFNYQVNEALHLSNREEKTLESIFENMYAEYHNNLDRFSQDVILSYLDLLLTYSNRFYARQFITRHQVSDDLFDRFQKALTRFFVKEEYQTKGLPTVSFFAEQLNVSPNYLSDFLKSNTGQSTQEHIHQALIEKAKTLLLSSTGSVSQIAFELGFEYPQYFSRLFKLKTGTTPKAFREGVN